LAGSGRLGGGAPDGPSACAGADTARLDAAGMSGIEFTRVPAQGAEPARGADHHAQPPAATEHSKVTGLEAGVDDYVTKPFLDPASCWRASRRCCGAAAATAAVWCRRKAGWRSICRSTASSRRASRCRSAHRVPAAALLHDPTSTRARLLALAAPRSGVGAQRVHRGTDGRRPHPPAAHGARAARLGEPRSDVRGVGYRFSAHKPDR